MKMKKWLIGGLFILLLGGFGFYYFSPPKAFYTQEQLLTVLKNYPDKQYRAEKIDDIIFLNDRHVFVPYTNHEKLLEFCSLNGINVIGMSLVAASICQSIYGSWIQPILQRHTCSGIITLRKRLIFR